jgi:cytochrome c553
MQDLRNGTAVALGEYMQKLGLLQLALTSLLAGCSGPAETEIKVGAKTGQTLATELGCAGCHDPTDGSGTLAGRSTPLGTNMVFPPNLTPDVETGLGGWTDAEIMRAIRAGMDDSGQPMCSVMPRYASLSDVDAAALVQYLRTLPPEHHEVPDTTCPMP